MVLPPTAQARARLGELTRNELTAFGPTAQQLMLALEEAFDAPARYLMTFGEAYPHFHAVVTVCGDDVPPEPAERRHPRPPREPRRPCSPVPDVRAAFVRVRSLDHTD